MKGARLLILSGILCAEPASADNWNCLEAWPPDMKTRPDFTCVPITERLLVSLEHATKAQVVKAMKADGRSVEIGLFKAADRPLRLTRRDCLNRELA
jgi:hypothetical protein